MIPVYLLLLPAFVCGKIAVYVDLTEEPPLIDVSGHSSILIPEKERLAFKLDDGNLMKSVAFYSKAAPTNVFVRNGWGNLYKTYDWQEVRRSVNPTLETKTDTRKSKECVTVPFELNTNMTVSSIWNNSIIPTNENSEYEIVYDSNRLKINSTWGKPINELRSNSFPDTKTNITKCMVNVYLEYEATLSKDVAVNYQGKMNGSHFWKFDVNNVQISAELPTSIFYQENIKIEYFTKIPLA